MALAAHAAGHAVRLHGARRLTDSDAQSTPFFASAYPAAAVIPHSILGDGIDEMFEDSNAVFGSLTGHACTGVRQQCHLELFEDSNSVVLPLVRHRKFENVDSLRDATLPRRRGASSVSGFRLSCFFCDMPKYAAWLDRKIDECSIEFVRGRLDPASVEHPDTDLLINCLGIGSSLAFPELDPGTVSRGILVRAVFEHPDRQIVSYNYTPEMSVHSDGLGNPSDLYFYPRDGHCMLGGTRQLGQIRADDRSFVPSAPLHGDTIEIDGVDVPRQIVDINCDLVEQLTGLRPSGPFRALVGYRHLAGESRSPKLVIEQRGNPSGAPIIDCYGFGGAGVTLSWGAAFKTLRICDSLIQRGVVESGETHLQSLTQMLLRDVA